MTVLIHRTNLGAVLSCYLSPEASHFFPPQASRGYSPGCVGRGPSSSRKPVWLKQLHVTEEATPAQG